MFEDKIAAGWDYEDMSRGKGLEHRRPACEKGPWPTNIPASVEAAYLAGKKEREAQERESQ